MNMNFDKIDKKEYKKQLKYFNDYYGSPFREGQGTEEILELINKYACNGTLIDFGSGSNIYFWLLAFKNIEKVLCVDISKEAFFLNEQIRRKELYPNSCEYVIKKYDKNFDDTLKIRVDYLICDVLHSSINNTIKYNNVSQFGLLGLCRSEKEYISNLKKLYNLLEKDGTLLGANWCFSESYSKMMGFNNNYLSEKIIQDFSKKQNCKILVVKKVPIANDPNYDSVLIYGIKHE
ncbi:MAG: hypothetical protein U0M92_04640 [Bacilli bacterium]